MVTHDHDLAERYADQIISLVDGRVADLDHSGPNGDNSQGLIAGLAGLADLAGLGSLIRR